MILFIVAVIFESILLFLLSCIALLPYLFIKEFVRQILYLHFNIKCYTDEELYARKLPFNPPKKVKEEIIEEEEEEDIPTLDDFSNEEKALLLCWDRTVEQIEEFEEGCESKITEFTSVMYKALDTYYKSINQRMNYLGLKWLSEGNVTRNNMELFLLNKDDILNSLIQCIHYFRSQEASKRAS